MPSVSQCTTRGQRSKAAGGQRVTSVNPYAEVGKEAEGDLLSRT